MIKIIRFKGGLGNQMFQYAFYLALKKRFPLSLFLFEMEEALHCHGGYCLDKICKVRTAKIEQRYQYTKLHLPWLLEKTHHVCQKNSLQYEPAYFNRKYPILIFDGYWQSEKYFYSIKNQVRETFSFEKTLLNERSKELANIISSGNYISVHIRRGDYLSLSDYFGLCTLDYYLKAIETLRGNIDKPRFVFFSDDIDWTRNNIPINNSIYVDWNKGKDCWQDMYLMSHCKHNIIANSSFSWWGAWLNNNPRKIVIAPKRWFNFSPNYDIIPAGWTTI